MIIFVMVQEVGIIIGLNNVFRAGFISDPGDNKDKKDKEKGSSIETPKYKVKNKGKDNKWTSGKIKKTFD